MTANIGSGLRQQATNVQTVAQSTTTEGTKQMNNIDVITANAVNATHHSAAKRDYDTDTLLRVRAILKKANIRVMPWIERLYDAHVEESIKPEDDVAFKATKLQSEEAFTLKSMNDHYQPLSADVDRPSAQEIADMALLRPILSSVQLIPQLRDGKFYLQEYMDQCAADPARHGVTADGRPYTIMVKSYAVNKLNSCIAQLTKVAFVAEPLDTQLFTACRKLASTLVGVRQRINSAPMAIAEFQIRENERGFGHEGNVINAENVEEALAILIDMGAMPQKIIAIMRKHDTVNTLIQDEKFLDWYQNAIEELAENRTANMEAAENAVTYRKPTDLMGHNKYEIRTIAEPVHHFSDFPGIRENYQLRDIAYIRGAVSTAVNYSLPRHTGMWQDLADHFEERMANGVAYARRDRETLTKRAWDRRGTKFYAKHRKIAVEQKISFMRVKRQMLNYVRFIKSTQGLGLTHVKRRNVVMQHGLNKFARRIFRDLFMAKKELSRLYDWLDNVQEVREHVICGTPTPGGMTPEEHLKFEGRVASLGRTAIDHVSIENYDGEPLSVRAFGFEIVSIDVPDIECNIVADGHIRILENLAMKLETLISAVELTHRQIRAKEAVLAEAGFWDDRESGAKGTAPFYWDMQGAYYTEEDAIKALAGETEVVVEEVIDIMEFHGEDLV